MPDIAPHQVSFLEIGSRDAAETRAFFSTIFGWPCHNDMWLQTPTIRAGVHGADSSP